MNFIIDPMQRSDWKQVRSIYGAGLATGLAAFRLTPPKWPAWHTHYLELARSVARDPDTGCVVGWAAIAPVPDT